MVAEKSKPDSLEELAENFPVTLFNLGNVPFWMSSMFGPEIGQKAAGNERILAYYTEQLLTKEYDKISVYQDAEGCHAIAKTKDSEVQISAPPKKYYGSFMGWAIMISGGFGHVEKRRFNIGTLDGRFTALSKTGRETVQKDYWINVDAIPRTSGESCSRYDLTLSLEPVIEYPEGYEKPTCK